MAYIKSRKHAVARSVPHTLTSAAAAATLLALGAPALAQTTQNKSLGEVKVEATAESDYKADRTASPKATAALIDTPQTITVIKEQIIREQGASTLTEALRNSPGVGTFSLGENGNTNTGDAIFMRGTDASSSIFVDGVRDLGSISRDVFNIEQIEVLKGAAGADIGRGSATGAINLYTKQPSLENAFSGSVGAGSGDYKRATADLNRKIGDTSAFRLNLVTEDSGVAGRNEVTNKRWGFAPSFAFGLNTPTKVYIDYLHLDQKNKPDGGVYTIGLPGFSAPDPAGPAYRNYVNSAPRVDSSNYYGLNSDHDDAKVDMFTVIVDHDFGGGFKMRNTTRYGTNEEDQQLSSFMATTTGLTTTTGPGLGGTLLPQSAWTLTRNMNNKLVRNTIATNQTHFSGEVKTGPFSHSFGAGLELIREEQKTWAYATVAGTTVPNASVYYPNPNASYSRTLTGAYTFGTTNTIALYAADTMKLTEQWLLTGGVRYDKYRTAYNSVTVAGVGAPQSVSDGVFSGKFGVTYKPAQNGSVYASYAVTKLPPGGANFQVVANNTNSVNSPSIDPQTAATSEIGTKWDILNNKVSLTGAIYQTKYKDQIALDSTTGQYYRAGNKTVQGIELGAIGNITNVWAVSAGYTTMDTKVEGSLVSQDGSSDIPYNPTSAFTLWTTYKLPMGLTLGGGARYSGKMKRGTDGAIGTPQFTEAYWVFDAMASYQLTKNVDIQLNLYNLFDKDYVAAINKSGYRYIPGIPRSARLTANFTF